MRTRGARRSVHAVVGLVLLTAIAGVMSGGLFAGSASGQTVAPCRDESLPYDEAKSNNEGIDTPFLGILDVRLIDNESVEFDWCISLPAEHGTLHEPNFESATFAMGGYQANGNWIGSAPTIVKLIDVDLGETIYGTTLLSNSGDENYLNLSVILEGQFVELAIRARYDHVSDADGNRLEGNAIELVSPPAVVVVWYDFGSDTVIDPSDPGGGSGGDPGDPSDPGGGSGGDPGDPGGSGTPLPTCYFPDVEVTNTHAESILAICIRQITQGYADGTYRPAAFVTRAQMASFLARALKLTPVSTSRFSDVSGTHATNINSIAEAGVTVGCNTDSTEFCPDDFVTRAQMASFLARAFKLATSGANAFQDVVTGSTHAANTDALRIAGVTLGCDVNGTLYCPDEFVRRDQMASFIERSLEYVEATP